MRARVLKKRCGIIRVGFYVLARLRKRNAPINRVGSRKRSIRWADQKVMSTDALTIVLGVAVFIHGELSAQAQTGTGGTRPDPK